MYSRGTCRNQYSLPKGQNLLKNAPGKWLLDMRPRTEISWKITDPKNILLYFFFTDRDSNYFLEYLL